MCSKDSVGTGYSTQLQAKLKQEQIDKHHCFPQHMHLYGQGICIGYSKCCQSGSYYSKEWMQPNINMEPAPFLWLLVEMSVLSPKWLRRSNMWCDRRPGSQPSISAETAWLICRVGGCGVWGEDDIDGIICMSAKLQAREWLQGSYGGNRWDVMASAMFPWLERSQVPTVAGPRASLLSWSEPGQTYLLSCIIII